jgi:hypothetical protein
MNKCLRCGATNEWIEPMGRRSAKAKAPVLTARDWAAIWTAFGEWSEPFGRAYHYHDWPEQKRKIQTLVNARLKQKARTK